MKSKDILLVTLLAVVPVSVFAADNTSAPQGKFNGLDKNYDGYISSDEALADKQLSQKWSEADSNKDGKLDQSEFSAFEVDSGSAGMPEDKAE